MTITVIVQEAALMKSFTAVKECGVGLDIAFILFGESGCMSRPSVPWPSSGPVLQPTLLGTRGGHDPFICPDDGGTPGCTINKSLVDNNVCDCPGTCADETNYTCENCSAVLAFEFVVSFVGAWNELLYCLPTPWNSEHIQLGHQPSVV